MPEGNRKLGLIVNPVAGMGGSVGLKGTDGPMYERALTLGAEPVTPKRTRDFLNHIEEKDAIALLVAPGKMGAQYVADSDLPFTVIGESDERTSAEDTRRIARQMVAQGVELLIFVGGDGTARDIYDAIGTQVPVVGVPAGVKVFSAAFALSARAAAEMVDAFIEGAEVTEEEVLDIDEAAFREDRLASQRYGYLLVPEARRFLQPGKAASNVSPSSAESKRDIAAYIVEEMEPEVLYLLGPGTTLRAIADALGVSKTLLGVDAVHAGELVGEDVNERDILQLFERYEQRKIIVTPIGGNGFIFGRGSKQFTPTVIRQVGADKQHPADKADHSGRLHSADKRHSADKGNPMGNIIVVSTRHKLSNLDCLRVDTGDLELDETLAGYITVTVGYREGMMVKVAC